MAHVKELAHLGSGITLKPQSEEPTNPDKGTLYVTSTGQLKVYDGAEWQVASNTYLQDLDDTSDATPSTGDILQWNASTSTWDLINLVTLTGLIPPGSDYTDISDIGGALVANDDQKQVYRYSSSTSKWEPSPFPVLTELWNDTTVDDGHLEGIYTMAPNGDQNTNVSNVSVYDDDTGIFSPPATAEGYWLINLSGIYYSKYFTEGSYLEIILGRKVGDTTDYPGIKFRKDFTAANDSLPGYNYDHFSMSIIVDATSSDSFETEIDNNGLSVFAYGDYDMYNINLTFIYLGPSS